MQRDPNETAAPILAALAWKGEFIAVLAGVFDMGGQYGNGMNLYGYQGANPVNRLDPLGLDFQDDIDAALAGVVGDASATFASLKAELGFSFNIASTIAQMAFSLVPGADAVILIGKLAMGDKIGIGDVAAGVLSLGGGAIIAKVVGRTFKALGRVKNAEKIGRARSGVQANRAAGLIGENFLRDTYGGAQQVFRRTSQGGRYIDNLANGIAMESKVGRTSLTSRVRAQIAKDVELMNTPQSGVDMVEWHFFASSTGVGPTGPLRSALENAGITTVLYP